MDYCGKIHSQTVFFHENKLTSISHNYHQIAKSPQINPQTFNKSFLTGGRQNVRRRQQQMESI